MGIPGRSIQRGESRAGEHFFRVERERPPPRLRGYPRRDSPGGIDIRVASTFRARAVGLALLPSMPAGVGLLLAGRSVHTLGMRFALDLVWLDPRGRVVRIDEGVPPLRLRTCLKAVAVLELRAGEARRAGLADQ